LETLSTILSCTLVVVYAAAVVVYLRYFMTRAAALRWLCRPVMLFTLGLHLLYLTTIGLAQRGLPLVGPGQATTVMVCSAAAIYLLVEWRTGRRVMGVFVLGLVAAMQLFAAVMGPQSGMLPEDLRTLRLPLHALPAIVGYAGLSLGAVFSLLLLMLRSRIKRRKLGLLYRRLPSLRVLDTMGMHANVLGFALLTLGLATGCIWAALEWGTPFPRDLKLAGMAAVGALYLAYVLSPRIPGLTRYWRAVWSLVSFAALVFNFTVLGMLVESRHSW